MRRAVALALALAVAWAAPAAAERASMPDIEDEVMCVTCGVALNIAESPQAHRQRAFIRDLVERGRTKAEIKDALVAEYGRAVLAMPEDDGFGLAAYLVPAGVVAGLVVGLGLLLPRWRRRRPAAAPAAPLSPGDERRVAEELDRFGR